MKDQKTNKLEDPFYNIQFTNHSIERCIERGITYDDIQIALSCSISYYKQALIFHVVLDKLIPEGMPKSIKARIKNLVIIISNFDCDIITAYRSEKAHKRIKRKRDRRGRDRWFLDDQNNWSWRIPISKEPVQKKQ